MNTLSWLDGDLGNVEMGLDSDGYVTIEIEGEVFSRQPGAIKPLRFSMRTVRAIFLLLFLIDLLIFFKSLSYIYVAFLFIEVFVAWFIELFFAVTYLIVFVRFKK